MANNLIDRLPNYIENDGRKFFLQISKDSDGRWSAAYVGYHDCTEDEEDTHDQVLCYINESDDLNEVYTRLSRMLKVRGY